MTVVATRHEAIKSFAIIAALIFSWLVTGVFLKIFDRVRDASEAVDVAQFGIHTFVAKSVTYGRACFDRLESDTFGSEVIGQFAECLRALQVHAWRSGEVEEDELRQRRLSAYAIEDRLADMVHVEIDETRFGPENQHAMNQFVVRMAGAIGKAARSGDASQESDVWPRSAAQQLDQRNDRADKDAA